MINLNELINHGKFFAKKFAELKFQLDFFCDFILREGLSSCLGIYFKHLLGIYSGPR